MKRILMAAAATVTLALTMGGAAQAGQHHEPSHRDRDRHEEYRDRDRRDHDDSEGQ